MAHLTADVSDILQRLRAIEVAMFRFADAIGVSHDPSLSPSPSTGPLRCSAMIVADDQAMRCEWYGNEAIHSGHHVVTVAGHKINWRQSPLDR